MKILKRLFRNLIIFCAAILFSFGIVFLVKNPNLLQASILNATEISIIKENQWEIAYKQNTDHLDIFYNGEQKNLTIVLLYDETIVLKIDQIEGQCGFTIIDSNKNSSKLELICENINKNETAIIIPFEGLAKNILIDEAFFLLNDKKENLSIGNITENNQHSN